MAFSLPNFSRILLPSFLLYVSRIYCAALEMKRSSHTNVLDSLGLTYDSFVTDADTFFRTYSTKLLTSDARIIVAQQNTHSILKMLLGDYRLSEYSVDGFRESLKNRLKTQGKTSIDVVDIFDWNFLYYSTNLKSLMVTKILGNEQADAQYVKSYQVKARLPTSGALYSMMIAKGIDSSFVLRLLPRIISSYETNHQAKAPDLPDLTNVLNFLVKEFIWNHRRDNDEKIEEPSELTMKHLAKKFFKESLDAKLYTLAQGKDGNFYMHLVGKPCAVYENKTYISICYSKDSIELMERFKIPLCPLTRHLNSKNCFFYSIYTYKLNKNNKVEIDDAKDFKQGTVMNILETAMPLMKVPKGTILSTYIIFSKKNFEHILLNRKQRLESNKKKTISKDQGDKSIPFSSSTISNEQLHIFMNHFAAYLYTKSNTDLFEIKDAQH